MGINDIVEFSALPSATFPLVGNEIVALVQNGVTVQAPLNTTVVLANYSKVALPVGTPGALIYVTDEVGGAVPAFADNLGVWRRVTDRAVVS